MTERQLSVVDHLAELRRVLIICFISVFAGALICYSQAGKLLALLTRPVGRLVFIAPQEAFVVHLKVAFIAGFFIALPVILFLIWRFVAEGLKPSERKYVLIFAPFSVLLFCMGVSFVFFVILPIGIKFLLGFASDTLSPMISVNQYVSFAGTLLIAFGLVFELPLVMMFLAKIGVISPQFLRKKRKYNILLIFIVSAILTPPDVVTQLLMAGPLMFLYELSIILAGFVKKSSSVEST